MSDLNEIERGQLCQSTIESLYEASAGLRQFPGLLKKIIRYEAWKRRENRGHIIELASLRELITEKPLKGWGEDPKKVEAVIKDDPEALAMFRGAMVEKPGKRPKGDADIPNNVRNKEVDAGNSRAYSIDRVKRECDPETVAAVMAGELSPNKALVQAGVRARSSVEPKTHVC
jgi:hypothetical protein